MNPLVSAINLAVRKEIEAHDTHGLNVVYDEEGFPRVELPNVVIYLERRPFYCDRGRWGFWAESKGEEKVDIDYADGFPRYFFSLQRALDEMKDWVDFRKLETPK